MTPNFEVTTTQLLEEISTSLKRIASALAPKQDDTRRQAVLGLEPKLEALLAKARAAYEAMTPEEQHEMHRLQAESYGRSCIQTD